jgi:hypothetical protein
MSRVGDRALLVAGGRQFGRDAQVAAHLCEGGSDANGLGVE